MIVKGTKFNPFLKADKVIMSSNGKAIIKVNNFKTNSGLPVEQRTVYPNNKTNFENYVVALAKKNNFINKKSEVLK